MAGEEDQGASSMVTWAGDSPNEARLNRKMRKFDFKRAEIFCPIKESTSLSESPPSLKPFYEKFLEKSHESPSAVEPKKHSSETDDLVCCLKKLIEVPIRATATEADDRNDCQPDANKDFGSKSIYRLNPKEPELSSSFDDAFLDDLASFMNHSETDDLFASIDLQALSQADTPSTSVITRKRPATFSGDTPTSSAKAQLQFGFKDASTCRKKSFHKNLNEQLDKIVHVSEDEDEAFWNDTRVLKIARQY
uniref:Uncharacterized protein n=1 Tax=Trichuris muris TaxID=70415 RepID=A0A5S6QXV4_TRIMR